MTEMIRLEKTEARSPIKWVGGKRQLLSEILRYVPRDFGAYHEPFIGGGAVFFALSSLGLLKEQSTLSDLDHLRKHENKESRYYAVRADNMLVGSKARRAADLLFLNRTCFNGLYRENKKGQFNVPFGDNPKATICDEDKLRAASRALAKASIGGMTSEPSRSGSHRRNARVGWASVENVWGRSSGEPCRRCGRLSDLNGTNHEHASAVCTPL